MEHCNTNTVATMGSANGLVRDCRQAIIWTDDGQPTGVFSSLGASILYLTDCSDQKTRIKVRSHYVRLRVRLRVRISLRVRTTVTF